MLLQIDEVRALEALASADLPAGELMRRAGAAAARWVDSWLVGRGHARGRVLVLCGPGNNGGDGFVCASVLAGLGHDCLCWAPLASATADAIAARAGWCEGGGAIAADSILPGSRWHVAVDALFGIGTRRALADPFLAALRGLVERGVPRIALDVPSGIDADTGAWIGTVAGATALETITFLADKPGLHLSPGREAAGTVRVETLSSEGLRSGGRGRCNGPEAFAALLQARDAGCNKGDHGRVLVVGGASGMVGAAFLAARAALRLGAGRVMVDCLGAPELRFDPQQPELMLRPGAPPLAGEVVVAGCGMGTDATAHARLHRILAHGGPVVLDADTLNCLAADADILAEARARAHPTVLTPHPGEAARLLGITTRAVQSDRVGNARALASACGAVVALKGAATVIAEADGSYAINPTGGPALATAGTGDVLAGMIGALLAQGADAATAARGAVWLHGSAADETGLDLGLVASDIAERAVRRLGTLRRERQLIAATRG